MRPSSAVISGVPTRKSSWVEYRDQDHATEDIVGGGSPQQVFDGPGPSVLVPVSAAVFP